MKIKLLTFYNFFQFIFLTMIFLLCKHVFYYLGFFQINFITLQNLQSPLPFIDFIFFQVFLRNDNFHL